MIKSLPWSYLPPEQGLEHRLRRAAATSLLGFSRMLTRLARRLAAKRAGSAPHVPEGPLEFYAEAGAPEGALYANGLLVGYVTGVRRL